jgi:hypothetical protein
MGKMKALTAGALVALALASVPAVASAGEYTGDCETGATCSGTISGGAAAFANSSGETIGCSAISGTASMTSGSSTGTVQLSATGCVETISGFKFSCTNTATAGKITTNNMVAHGVYVDSKRTIPGILITGVNVTFSCASFITRTVTGNILGAKPNAECGVFKASDTASLNQTAHGVQQYTQVTETGTVFDLIANNDNGGAYLTTSLTGSLTITGTTKVKATC